MKTYHWLGSNLNEAVRVKPPLRWTPTRCQAYSLSAFQAPGIGSIGCQRRTVKFPKRGKTVDRLDVVPGRSVVVPCFSWPLYIINSHYKQIISNSITHYRRRWEKGRRRKMGYGLGVRGGGELTAMLQPLIMYNKRQETCRKASHVTPFKGAYWVISSSRI